MLWISLRVGNGTVECGVLSAVMRNFRLTCRGEECSRDRISGAGYSSFSLVHPVCDFCSADFALHHCSVCDENYCDTCTAQVHASGKGPVGIYDSHIDSQKRFARRRGILL